MGEFLIKQRLGVIFDDGNATIFQKAKRNEALAENNMQSYFFTTKTNEKCLKFILSEHIIIF